MSFYLLIFFFKVSCFCFLLFLLFFNRLWIPPERHKLWSWSELFAMVIKNDILSYACNAFNTDPLLLVNFNRFRLLCIDDLNERAHLRPICFLTSWSGRARWLSGRTLDLRSIGRWLGSYRGHCVVSWEGHYIFCLPGKCPDMTGKVLIGTSVWTWLGLWSLEYEIQFQAWSLQARMALPSILVLNPNPNVYYWMLILYVKLVLNAKPGFQSQTWYSMHDDIHKYMWYSVPMLAFNVKPEIQSQTLYILCNVNFGIETQSLQCQANVRLVFNASFGIESQSFKINSIQN